jgi:hypothetical protein
MISRKLLDYFESNEPTFLNYIEIFEYTALIILSVILGILIFI